MVRALRIGQDVAAYLTQVIEEGDMGELAQALGVAARARGMAQIAQVAGIGRESLCTALRADASQRFETIAKICKALEGAAGSAGRSYGLNADIGLATNRLRSRGGV